MLISMAHQGKKMKRVCLENHRDLFESFLFFFNSYFHYYFSVGDCTVGFETDVSISSRTGDFGKERELLKWAPTSGDDHDSAAAAASAAALDGLDGADGVGKWDQFSTNERLFGVTTDFDERMYTTEIDRSAPDFKRKEAEALRIAREIEGDTRMVCCAVSLFVFSTWVFIG